MIIFKSKTVKIVALVLGAIVLLAIILFYCFVVFVKMGQLSPAACADPEMAVINGNPKTGIYKLKNYGTYADYYYRATLESVVPTKINDCDFVKFNMVFEPNSLNMPFTLYIPANFPSKTSDNKQIFPQQMSGLVNKEIEIDVRYAIDASSANPDSISKILSWQFAAVYYQTK